MLHICNVFWARPLALGLLLLSGSWGAASAASLSVDRLREHVEYLASDRLEGRETGEKGCRLAEEYVARFFEKSQLATLPGQDSYFEEFSLYRGRFDANVSSLTLHRDDQEWTASAGEDFRPFAFSGTGASTGEIVFAGYGISAPEYHWDDYADLEVNGKIVLVLRYEPQKDDTESLFDGSSNSPYAYFTTKAQNARDHGAIAILVVQGPLHGEDPGSFKFYNRLALEAETDDTEYIPAVQVRRGWVEQALRGTPYDLRSLQQRIEDGQPPASLGRLALAATLKLPGAGVTTTVPARNVVAFVQGADPVLREELLVVGAHHDHIGLGATGGDRIFNGADDNASGTAVLLELARQWKRLEPPPARSVVFVTFTAEEKGLLGSRALVQSGLLPLDQVRFMINLDMLGRNPQQDLRIYTDTRTHNMRDLIERANTTVELRLDFAEGSPPGNSDHSSFSRQDIPVLFAFTGTHEDYHKQGDHADKLSYEHMAKIGDLTFAVLHELANAVGDDFPNPTHSIDWLGAELTIKGSPSGLQGVITAIQPGSQAARLGLRHGDVITDIGTKTVLGDRRVGRLLENIKPEQPVELVLLRNDRRLSVELERARPGFLGIAYAALTPDDRSRNGLSDEEGVVVNQVLQDGPAAEAGMHAGDIIVRLQDRPVAYRNLVGRLQGLGAQETVELQVLRAGETLNLRVKLGEIPTAG